jgi:hypothetical protein
MNDPFFGPVTEQLLRPPPESAAAMAAAFRDPSVRVIPAEAESAVYKAISWADAVLQPPFRPPESLPVLAFPLEAGRYDVVRMFYRAQGHGFHVAQTRHLMSIRLENAASGRDGQPRAVAESLAREIFVMPERIAFVTTGRFRYGICGEQGDIQEGPIDSEWPHWHDLLSWWVGQSDVGFVTLKASGGPARELVMADEESNRSWFESS